MNIIHKLLAVIYLILAIIASPVYIIVAMIISSPVSRTYWEEVRAILYDIYIRTTESIWRS